MQVFRIPNLIIVALTQLLLGLVVLYPNLENAKLEPALDSFHFCLLIIVTLIITLSGYIINDYFDYEADLINKPNKNPRFQYSKKQMLSLYAFFTMVGFGVSVYLALYIEKFFYLWIYVGSQFLLYLYSRNLKIIPGIGNIMVALLCAGVVLILLVAEWENLELLSEIDFEKFQQLVRLFISFSLFAFLITGVREIVKDMEDWNGDRLQGKKTLVLTYGLNKSRNLAMAISLSLMISIFYWIAQNEGFLKWWNVYLFIATFFPLLLVMFRLWRAETSSDFGIVSKLLKFVMFLGLLYVLIKPV